MNPIMVIELFNIWGIDFRGIFFSSYGMKYIFVVVHYISKRVEDIALPNNEGKSHHVHDEEYFLQIWHPKAKY